VVKKTVPLTAGPNGRQIGEAVVDFDHPDQPMTMRLYDKKDAQVMADLILGGIVSEMSIAPRPESMELTPMLPPEMRDTLGPQVPQRIQWDRLEYEGRFLHEQ
jgi:hypothetical protein